MMASSSFSLFLVLSTYFVIPFLLYFPLAIATTPLDIGGGGGAPFGGSVPVSEGPRVGEEERTTLVSSEYGEISAVKISDGKNGCYHLHFITLNPRSLFLPAYLHSEMVLYVKSGSGILSWMNVERDDDKLQQVMLQRGVIYRLTPETVFYIQNNVDQSSKSFDYYQQPEKLQIHAIFTDSEFQLMYEPKYIYKHKKEEQFNGAYTGVQNLLLGFDNEVLEAALNVPEEVIQELRNGEQQPLIVQGQPEPVPSMWDVGSYGMRGKDIFKVQNKKKKKVHTIFNEHPDVETYSGWSVTVSEKEMDELKHTDFGVFMVNLTRGSMMGPHWNPKTDEVAVVLQGKGIVQVVCPSMPNDTGCKNSKFRVEEGDVFVVPRYHPMTQISFNDDSLVFMGFSLKLKNDIPQNVAGKFSMLQRLDKNVLAKSFNVRNTTIDWVLSAQREKIIFECISCAEEAEAAGRESEEGGRGGGGRQEGEGEGEIPSMDEGEMQPGQRETREGEIPRIEEGEMQPGQGDVRGSEDMEGGEGQADRPESGAGEEYEPAFRGGGAGEEGGGWISS